MQDSIAVGQRSAKAAEEAAQAANRNAKAAIHVELPIVTIKKLELHRNLGVVEKVNGGDIPAETNIVIDFKNRGRSAAELRSLTIQWEVCQKLRPEPFYRPDSKYPFAPGIYMEPNKTLPAGEGRFYVRLSDKHLTAISEETEFFWIYGLVAFADFMGEPHEARFCAKWVRYASHGDGALKPMGFVYDSEAPAAYTRNT